MYSLPSIPTAAVLSTYASATTNPAIRVVETMNPPPIICRDASAVFVAATIGAKEGPQDKEMIFLALIYVSDIRRVAFEA